jgi:acyl carrier protein
MNDVAAEIRDILVFHLGTDERRLTDDARLAEDLGADSLDVVEIVMSCEERFGVVIPNREATGLATLGDAVRCVTIQVEALAAAQLAAEKFSAARPQSRTHRLRAVLTAK